MYVWYLEIIEELLSIPDEGGVGGGVRRSNIHFFRTLS